MNIQRILPSARQAARQATRQATRLAMLAAGGMALALSLAAAASPVPHRPEEAPEPVASSGFRPSPAALQAVARVNHYRKLAGLAPVVLDERMSLGCQNHARYLAVNQGHPSVRGLGAHYEREGMPGYSPEGARAAVNSVIAPRRSLTSAVEAWMATLYHRVPLLRPNLQRVGFGYESGWAVMDAMSGMVGDEQAAVAFPTAGQTGVPTLFPNELPDPIPAGAPRPAGYPITLQFPTFGTEVTNVRAELTDASGNRVPFHLSHPERPACDFPQLNTVCLIPVRQLAPGATYTVSISALREGETVSRSWSFSTVGSSALSASARSLRGPAVAGARPSRRR